MKHTISDATWAAIEIAYTTTAKPVTRIASENNISPEAIHNRIRAKSWVRPTERPEYAPNPLNIIRSVEGRARSKGGVFDIAPVEGSLGIEFHLIQNRGAARQCSAILDDRPGEMDKALTCALPTGDSDCPYCPGHLDRFLSPRTVSAKELTRSLRRYA